MWTQQEIADEFYVSTKTIERLKSAITDKILAIRKMSILNQNEREPEVDRITKDLEDSD